MKKGLTIAVVIAMLILGVFALWYFYFQDSIGSGENPFGDALPFGRGEGADLPLPFISGPGSEDGPGVADGKPVERLFRVTEAPVAGAVLLGEGSSTTVRYTDRATGHIYDVGLATLEARKITNTTLPKIYESVFSKDGGRVIFRSLDEAGRVESLALTLTPPTSTSTDALYTASATVRRGIMTEISAGAGNSLFYVLADSSSVNISTFEGSEQRTILSSPFTAWRINALNQGLVMWTKANASMPGYAYQANTSNGSLTKLLGPMNGLSVKPSFDGSHLAFSYNSGDTRLFTKNSQSENLNEILPSTLAEKCVWSELEESTLFCGVPLSGVGNNEPDNWYKGITHFSDRIWRFETEVDIGEILAEPKAVYKEDLDAVELKLSSDEGYLVFTNRNDLSLWALKLD